MGRDLQKVSKKAIIYAVLDQDATYQKVCCPQNLAADSGYSIIRISSGVLPICGPAWYQPN